MNARHGAVVSAASLANTLRARTLTRPTTQDRRDVRHLKYRRLPPKIWGTSAWQLCRCETPGRLGSFIFVRVISLRSRRTPAYLRNSLWSRSSLSLKRYGRRNPLRGSAPSGITLSSASTTTSD